jgi:predicted RNA-binding Zn-ribbon protein involved in translation (DUF1610 family)
MKPTSNTPPTQPDAQQPSGEGLDDAICSPSSIPSDERHPCRIWAANGHEETMLILADYADHLAAECDEWKAAMLRVHPTGRGTPGEMASDIIEGIEAAKAAITVLSENVDVDAELAANPGAKITPRQCVQCGGGLAADDLFSCKPCRTMSASTPKRSPDTMQNQEPKSKPTDAEQESGKGLDVTPCCASLVVNTTCRANSAENEEQDCAPCPHCGSLKDPWFSRVLPMSYHCQDCGKNWDSIPENPLHNS